MSDKASSSNTPADSPETAEDIFARIQQRRGIPLAEAGQASTPALAEGQTERLVVEEADPAVKPADAPVAQRRLDEEHQAYDDFAARRVSARDGELLPVLRRLPMDDPFEPGFPRSKTFRFLLRNPGIVLLASLPVAHFALRSRTVRRTAFQLGKFTLKQQAWKQVRRFTNTW